MTLQNWSDYHAWHISAETMRDVGLDLGPERYTKLLMAAEDHGSGHLVPREAIEDAALALPPRVAIRFLANVYELEDELEGAQLLIAIQKVRK